MTYISLTFWITVGSCIGLFLLLLRVLWRVLRYRRLKTRPSQGARAPKGQVVTQARVATKPLTLKPTMRDVYFQPTPPTTVTKRKPFKKVLKQLWRAHVAIATLLVLILVTTVVVAQAGISNINIIQPSPVVADQWYDQAWSHRLPITIKHAFVEEELTDFPVLIKMQGTPYPIFAESPTGQDVVFTASDGVTKLPYELEKYQADTQELIAWVKVPKLSVQQDTQLYLYYGNSKASAQAEPTAVWSNGYTGVYNVGDSTAAVPVANAVKDVTDPTYRATFGEATIAPGKIGGALTLNGPKDVVDIPGAQVGDSGGIVPPMTISAWLKPQAKTGTIVGKRDVTATQWQFFISETGALHIKEDNNGSWPDHQSFGTQATSVTVGEWQYVAVTVDSTNTPTFYNNGTNEVGRYQNGVFQQYAVNAAIGARWLNYPTTDYPFLGDLDTIRLAKVARSAGWIKTEYANQAYNSAFLSISEQPEQATDVKTTVFTPLPTVSEIKDWFSWLN